MVNMSNAGETHHPSHGLRSRMSIGIDWFIPAHVRGGDLDVLRRARLVVMFIGTLILLAVTYIVMYLSMNCQFCAAALGLAIGVALTSLYIMRRTGSSFVTGNLAMVALYGVLTTLACRMGGQGALTLPWYAAVPVVALSTAGRRSAFFWLVVTVLSLAAFYALDYTGYSFPIDPTPRHYELLCLMGWIGLIALALALALLYEAAEVQMLHQVRQSKAVLENERKQMLSMFDGMDEVIYVADPQSYELLYMNAPARKSWGDSTGQPCYRALQNRDAPCPFCTNDRIFGEKAGQTYIWELQNVINKRWYRCIDRAIRWSDGRMVRFELAIDIHDRKEHETLLEQAKQTAESHARRATEAMNDMERMNAVMMGRELRVLEMKQEVNDLLVELGRASKYQHV